MPLQSHTALKKIAATYWKLTLWLLCALTLVGILALRQIGQLQCMDAIVVAVMFSLIAALAYGQCWLKIAQRAPQQLPKFYIAASALRLLAAAATVLIYCVAQRQHTEQIKLFAIVFLAYYIVMLVSETLYFARKTRQLNQPTNENQEPHSEHNTK